jgi:hypothetical protein
MPDGVTNSAWLAKLSLILTLLSEGKLALLLKNLLDTLSLAEQLRDRLT